MPARPVALRHGERSAQGVCFSCRGHAAVPISSGLGWLLMSGSMSGLRRAGTRGNRAGSEGSSAFWKVFRGRSSADWCFVVRQSLGGASRPDLADLPARYRCEGEGVAQCLRCPAFIRQSLGMRIDAVHQFLKNLAH